MVFYALSSLLVSQKSNLGGRLGEAEVFGECHDLKQANYSYISFKTATQVTGLLVPITNRDWGEIILHA